MHSTLISCNSVTLIDIHAVRTSKGSRDKIFNVTKIVQISTSLTISINLAIQQSYRDFKQSFHLLLRATMKFKTLAQVSNNEI